MKHMIAGAALVAVVPSAPAWEKALAKRKGCG